MVVLADPVRGCVCRSELTFFTLCHTLKLDSLLKGQIHLYIHLWIQSNIVSREVSVKLIGGSIEAARKALSALRRTNRRATEELGSATAFESVSQSIISRSSQIGQPQCIEHSIKAQRTAEYFRITGAMAHLKN